MSSKEEYEAEKRARYRAQIERECREEIEQGIREKFENRLPYLIERTVIAIEKAADALHRLAEK